VYKSCYLLTYFLTYFVDQHDDDEDDDEGFKLPKLIRHLQTILHQYPDDGQILKVNCAIFTNRATDICLSSSSSYHIVIISYHIFV